MNEKEKERQVVMNEVQEQVEQVMEDYKREIAEVTSGGSTRGFLTTVREIGSIIEGRYNRVENVAQLEGVAFAALAILVALGRINDMDSDFQ